MNRADVERRREVRSPPHRCGGTCRLVRQSFGENALSREPPRSKRWCERRCDRYVWTRDPDCCRLRCALLTKGPRPRMRRPPSGGSRAPYGSPRATRASTRVHPSLETGSNAASIGIALSKRDCQARLETAGPRPETSVLILRDEHPHICSQSLEGCRLFGTRGLLPPGFEVSFLSSVRG